MLRELLEEYGLDDAEIGRDTKFHDLELDSIDLVTLSGRLRDHYGDKVNFAEFVAERELAEIIALTVGELDVHVRRLGPEAGDAQVVMYDLRGHGRTTRPATGYRLEEFVADLDGLLATLEIDRPVHVVGNSFGGSVAFGLAASRPERVASVIAIEAEPPVRAWIGHMAEGLADAKNRLAHDEVIGWIAENHGAHTARLSKTAYKILAATTLAEDIPLSRTIGDDLAAVRCPVFALFGDPSGLSAQVPDLEPNLARCRTVVLPEQGHSVLVERTAETTELILGWVREHSCETAV
ncbi:alpha/beta fold hydrolase [Amycolatopsis speibonae]|uniref:Alpha/beta fold hydrolase n=1 Tax=Amycolatopsis speibonae TaxID=1450224 RepID=A0ABV7P6Z9_9PSEU